MKKSFTQSRRGIRKRKAGWKLIGESLRLMFNSASLREPNFHPTTNSTPYRLHKT